MAINSVSSSNIQKLKNLNLKQQNISFKGNGEKIDVSSDKVTSKGAANALRNIVLAGMLMAGGIAEGKETPIRPENDVKTSLVQSDFHNEVTQNLLTYYQETFKDSKISPKEQAKILADSIDKVMEQTSAILISKDTNEQEINLEVVRKNAKKMAQIMTDDKLDTKAKIQKFAKLSTKPNADKEFTGSLIILASSILLLTGVSKMKNEHPILELILAGLIIGNGFGTIEG